jgi:hypothetical protein
MSPEQNPVKFHVPETVLARTVGTETILLNLESSTYHSLNSVGGRFWALLLEGKDFQQALAIMQNEYEVEPAQLEADLRELCAELQELSLLQPTA